jgi:hypothetical protein
VAPRVPAALTCARPQGLREASLKEPGWKSYTISRSKDGKIVHEVEVRAAAVAIGRRVAPLAAAACLRRTKCVSDAYACARQVCTEEAQKSHMARVMAVWPQVRHARCIGRG